jgi:hypothetical protein
VTSRTAPSRQSRPVARDPVITERKMLKWTP